MMFGSECRGCGLELEPETQDIIDRHPSPSTISSWVPYWDTLIKDIKLGQGLCLQTRSLGQRFNFIYLRHQHISLMNWVSPDHDGTIVDSGIYTIRAYTHGVGGYLGAYINNNFTQQDDKFSPNSKFGAYVTGNFDGRIMGFQTTAGGSGAAQMTLSKDLGDRIYDSWGANPQQYFDNTTGAGMREIVRGGSYDNNGTIGGRTKLYQGQIGMTGAVPSTVRTNFDLNFYSLASNQSNLGTPNGTAVNGNTTGWSMFEFSGSYLINSPNLVASVERYLTAVGAI